MQCLPRCSTHSLQRGSSIRAPAHPCGSISVVRTSGPAAASAVSCSAAGTGACSSSGRGAAAPVARQAAGRSPVAAAAAVQEGAAPVPAGAGSSGSVEELKQQLRAQLEGIDRGIFGTTSAKREAVLALVSALEAFNPTPQPLQHMERLEGDWRLLYTTITITGVKKTKLGLREFVKLGDFIQRIDTQQHTAVVLPSNEVSFSVTGFGKFKGRLAITADYAPAPPPHAGSRVDIAFKEASLAPEALEQLFRANYALLLSIFNPEGWLDVTYVDEEIRVGRDDKGNVFVVERC